jgi:hypothetical protein
MSYGEPVHEGASVEELNAGRQPAAGDTAEVRGFVQAIVPSIADLNQATPERAVEGGLSRSVLLRGNSRR